MGIWLCGPLTWMPVYEFQSKIKNSPGGPNSLTISAHILHYIYYVFLRLKIGHERYKPYHILLTDPLRACNLMHSAWDRRESLRATVSTLLLFFHIFIRQRGVKNFQWGAKTFSIQFKGQIITHETDHNIYWLSVFDWFLYNIRINFHAQKSHLWVYDFAAL